MSEEKTQVQNARKDLDILNKMKNLPGGLVIIPLVIAVVLATFVPQVFQIGGYVTALFYEGNACMMGFFLIVCGSMIDIKQVGMPLYKGVIMTGTKFLLGVIASALTDEEQEMTLEQFMEKVEQKNTKTVEKWNQYLDNLAILISNLRMAYDTDIILGGEVGGYLSEYMIPLGEKVMAYNGFEHDVRYLKNCSYKREASAVGAAKHFLSEYIQHL